MGGVPRWGGVTVPMLSGFRGWGGRLTSRVWLIRMTGLTGLGGLLPCGGRMRLMPTCIGVLLSGWWGCFLPVGMCLSSLMWGRGAVG